MQQKTKMEELLGGRTRFAILEALAEAKKPMAAYRIAMVKGLDPAATYRYLTDFSEFGVVEPVTKGRKQTSYKLSEGAGKAATAFLRSLKKQKTPATIDLDEWMSPEMQSRRTARIIGLANQFNDVVAFERAFEEKDVEELLSRRIAGELSALIASSQIAFRELFEQKDNVFILKT